MNDQNHALFLICLNKRVSRTYSTQLSSTPEKKKASYKNKITQASHLHSSNYTRSSSTDASISAWQNPLLDSFSMPYRITVLPEDTQLVHLWVNKLVTGSNWRKPTLCHFCRRPTYTAVMSNHMVNFEFARKLDEIVCKQFMAYLTDNNQLPELQSAYGKNLSAEASVMKVLSDILLALDYGNLALLTLSDLSATF